MTDTNEFELLAYILNGIDFDHIRVDESKAISQCVEILTTLANVSADEPERDEHYYDYNGVCGTHVDSEYAEWQRNGRLRAELSLKAAANNNDRLRAEIEQLRAKLAEAQKNELRYFLLRQVFMDEDGVKLVENVLLEKPSDEAGFDAGIDAAIAQQGEV